VSILCELSSPAGSGVLDEAAMMGNYTDILMLPAWRKSVVQIAFAVQPGIVQQRENIRGAETRSGWAVHANTHNKVMILLK
jgi:hypothetical protein